MPTFVLFVSAVSILNYRNRTILSYLVRRSVLFLTRYDRQKIAFLNILTLRQIDVTEIEHSKNTL